MSTEKGHGKRLSSPGTSTPPLGTNLEERDRQRSEGATTTQSEQVTPLKEVGERSEGGRSEETAAQSAEEESKSQASRNESAATVNREAGTSEAPRQVIAVSASKGPAAFFNLARKFLATDEMCDLSALEGAIVSAVDAAHLLERSQLATIVRVHTSYVTVEPKRRKQASQLSDQDGRGVQKSTHPVTSTRDPSTVSAEEQIPAKESKAAVSQPQQEPITQQGGASSRQSGGRGTSGRELRRARIVITVRRTPNYQRWLEENPLQAMTSGDADTIDSSPLEQTPGGRKQRE